MLLALFVNYYITIFYQFNPKLDLKKEAYDFHRNHTLLKQFLRGIRAII